MEAIEKQSRIDLPRTLDANKKYSWRQRKEEPVRRRVQTVKHSSLTSLFLISHLLSLQLYSKMSMDVLDAVEVEYRVRLAELQKTYKEKQKEMSKLQRRRDKQ